MELPLPLIIGVCATIGVAIALMIFGSRPQRSQGAAIQKMAAKLYKFFSTFFLTSGRMRNIVDQLSALSIYNRPEIQALATKYFLMSSSISIAIVVCGFILFNDTMSTLICVTFALIINNVLVDKQVEKVNLKVYKALRQAVSSIRQEYLKTDSVTEAVSNADIPAILRRPFDNIYSILTSADGELQLLKFYESSPFRSLQTLAGICYNINNDGDEKDAYGNSNFVQALTMLSSDINSELEKIQLMKTKFGIIEYLTIIPIFCMNIIEGYFTDIMPGTALIYNGLIGYAARTITLLSCAVCYKLVTGINSTNSVKDDDRPEWTKRLLENKQVYSFIKDIIPKDGNKPARKSKRYKTELKLRRALSKKELTHFYLEKVVYGAVALVFAVITVSSIVSMSRDYYMNSTDQLSLVADESMDAYSKEEILQMDMLYLTRDREWSDEQLQSTIKSYMPSLSDLQVLDQVSRLKNKEASLNSAYFHWYYMIICFAVAGIGWMIPNLLLMLRKLLIATEAEDDFLQLQTLMAILMNMNIDTLDAIWQLCQHSRIHKDSLLYCYHSYPSNPQLELARLKSRIRLPDFQRFIGKLELTISDLSLAEAYSDLQIEREHMVRTREVATVATINKKRKICGPIAMAPFVLMIVGEFVLPIGYLGLQEFTKALSSMG